MLRHCSSLVFALAPLLLLGCLDEKADEDDGGGHDTSAVPGEGPDIELSAEALELPAAAVGGASSETLGITNRGVDTLRLDGIDVDGDPAFTLTLPDRLQVDPGDTTELVVTFRPESVAAAEATLVIRSNDPDEPALSVPLSGIAGGPAAEADATADLGVAAPGCSTTGVARIESVGTEDLTVLSAHIDPPFAVDGGTLPAVLAPGESLELPIHYDATTPGEHTQPLRIDTDAGEVSTVITARAQDQDWTQDTFVARSGETDVLFAVDRSCSMHDDIAAVMRIMPEFTETLDDRGLDWRVSVVVDDDGCIDGPNLYIDPTFAAADIETVTQRMINVGASYNSNTERAFLLMEAGVTESAPGGCNAGLLRPDASLNLVGVTDEPEQSPEPYDHYVALFQALKADSEDVAMHAIAGVGACAGASASRFEDAAAATGGVVLDICEDMGANLDDLAAALALPDPATYPLSGTPIPSTITVTVDGAVGSAWTHDAASGRIVFDAGATPDDGETVVIEYLEDACP